MHVLTKLFIVLVALLAILLVPLVVVHAKNENTYKARYERAEQTKAVAEQTAQRAQLTQAVETQKLQGTINELRNQIGDFQRQVAERNAQVARLQSDLATTKQTHAQIASKISMIESQLASGQTLIERLVTEAGDERKRALALESRNAELEVGLREQRRNLEVAESAVRSLQEEVQRLSEANAVALERIGRYARMYPDIDRDVAVGRRGEPITQRVFATIIDVQPSNGVMMAEIDAGQRDGVKVGWEMTIGDSAGNYIGTLRIVRVDLNRATGIAETPRGTPASVALGHQAVAFPD